jgi:hypothetical protein
MHPFDATNLQGMIGIIGLAGFALAVGAIVAGYRGARRA